MHKRTMITAMICASLFVASACAAAPSESTAPAAVTSTTAAPAADTAPVADPAADTTPAAMPEETAVPYSIGIKAVVNEVVNENGNISLEVTPEGGEPLVLLVSDRTIIADNQTAVPVNVQDIRKGDTIYAYHDMMMTMSIPAQTPAIAILTNLGESAQAHLHMPEQLQPNGDNVSALCDNGSIWVRTADDTVITPYKTRQMVTAADIRIGQPFLAWYDIVMESYPAQAVAKRVMILPADLGERELSLVIDDDMVIKAKMADGVISVPARLTAGTLGLTVGYRREGGKGIVTLSNDAGELDMVIGEDAYSYRAATSGAADAAAALPYGVAPYSAAYLDGAPVTWMSAEAFELLGYEVNLSHEQLTIRNCAKTK